MNEENILGIIEKASGEIDADNIDEILAKLSKYERLIDKFSGIYARLDRSGVISVILRVLGKKYDVEVEKPIQNPLMIISTTASHKALYELLNELPEKEIRALHEQIVLTKNLPLIQEQMKKQEQKIKNKRK